MHIAIIGCGEVGGAYGRALAGKASLSLCDIRPDGPPREAADDLGLELHPAPGSWLTACDVAIAAVPGGESLAAAASALPFLKDDALYIDVSTASPDDKRAAEAQFTAAGRAIADVAIMTAIALSGAASPVLIAGPEATRAVPVFERMEAPVTVLEDSAVGDAVSLKLLRSIVVKGLEVLAVESLTAAERLGVRDKLLAQLGDLDAQPIAAFLAALTTTHIRHAARRMHEVEDAARQLEAMGLEPIVTGALAGRYRATLAAARTKPPGDEAHRSLDAALAWFLSVGRE
ncbi:MAG: DUF1932 domain-containing protein [Hyphomicrobiales bacterium]|nr:DUF1932 domain-containing protein [Hyphomicrobiales bacterium]